jgi:hypothetical protein
MGASIISIFISMSIIVFGYGCEEGGAGAGGGE